MALAKHTLTNGYWKKISIPGETGVLWWKTANGFDPIILIAHSTVGQVPGDNIPLESAAGLYIDTAYRVPLERISDVLTPDDSNDIFYATLLNTGKTCEIITDFAAT